MFDPLPPDFDFPAAERQVRSFWEQHDIFAASIRQRQGRPRFVFYEGPPTANGLPHPGHALTRVIKDVFPRYRTMAGYLCERKAGWDTHGLPVEVEVCKELGLHTKDEIERYGVEKFNLRCINSVWRYMREWEELTRRLGFWVSLDEAYATYHKSYVESVWWSLKTLFDRGLLYQGHKIVWWWCQGGTALSAGEVGLGYRTVDDPSVFVKFPLSADLETEPSSTAPGETSSGAGGATVAAERTSLLIWTTTPWTLISNHFAAVHPELEYALVHDPVEDEHLYIAAALVEGVAAKLKRELRIVRTCRGAELVGLRYLPPFACYWARRPEPTAFDGPDEQAQAALPLGRRVAGLRSGGTAPIGWRVTAAEFVSLESGTGLVHEAPAFGEVDFDLLQKERARFASPLAIPLLCAVLPNGTFSDEAPERYRGRWIKDCDKDIIRELRDERKTPWGTPLLYHQETCRHEYPFCWRASEDPLIQYARRSWFVRTSQFKDELVRNNAQVNWLPEHIKEGRFGDFLRNNVDWALSRERYWGTPLPIWVCEKSGKMEALGSFAELLSRPGATDGGYWERKVAEHRAAGDAEMPEHLRVHKPYIDEWTYDSPFEPGARMRRVPEVIDCWWDAGSMPFAQWGFPHAPGSVAQFSERFPADFISEAIDQTRGWFYGLLAISTLLFGPAAGRADAREAAAPQAPRPLPAEPLPLPEAPYPLPYRTCICLGLIMGEDGNKMSKSLRNYKEPTYIFDIYGADAMRWYFLSAQAPWTSVRFAEANIRDAQREFLLRLCNVLSFFNIYANIDGFTPIPRPEFGHRPTAQRSELDRWIISELHRTIRDVRAALDRFENFAAAKRLNDFVDALSNWYVRRSRERFWRPLQSAGAPAANSPDQDKWDAYHTLYGCLHTLSALCAPFTPFLAETMYQNLVSHPALRSAAAGGDAALPPTSLPSVPPAAPPTAPPFAPLSMPLSVHLCDYPEVDPHLLDEQLAEEMELVRELVSQGRAARSAARLKVRQPLALAEIVLARPQHAEWLAAHRGLIAEELNIQRVEFTTSADQYVSYKVAPNFKLLGAKYRGLAQQIKPVLENLPDPAAARQALEATGQLVIEVAGRRLELTPEEVDIRLEARPGWSAAQGRAGVVVVQTELTPELLAEGQIRELIHHVQQARKEQNLPYQARIRLALAAPEDFLDLVRRYAEMIRSDCLASEIEHHATLAGGRAVEVEGVAVQLAVTRL